MITSNSLLMDGTHVQSSWMISPTILLHCAMIYLEMESGMKLIDVLESTKQLWTLKLNISNDRKNCGQSKFTYSLWSTLSTDVSDLLALWYMCCTWWQHSCSRTTRLYMVTRWIYRRDIRCDRMHGSWWDAGQFKGINSDVMYNDNSLRWLFRVYQVNISIKSKGGDCWHYDTSVVLDDNSLRW